MQNVGDFERVLRTGAGSRAPVREPCGTSGHTVASRPGRAVVGLSGVTGWCPFYHAAGVTSMEGPGDRPEETTRDGWLVPPGTSRQLPLIPMSRPERFDE